MIWKNRRGLTLVEALVSIVLVSALLLGIVGAFIIARLGVDRAKHRMMAMNTIRECMEQEIRAGYLGGYPESDYYVTFNSANAKEFAIETTQQGTLTGTIKPDPFPATTYTIGTSPKTARYKKVGFVVEWTEKLFGGASMPTSRERAVAYVADHN